MMGAKESQCSKERSPERLEVWPVVSHRQIAIITARKLGSFPTTLKATFIKKFNYGQIVQKLVYLM